MNEPVREKQLVLVPESGDARVGPIAEVALPFPSLNAYTYAIPDELRDQVQPGALVTVPYRNRRQPVTGICFAVSEKKWTRTLRPIEAVESAPFALPEPLAELGTWVAQYYLCNPFLAFRAILGPGRKLGGRRKQTWVARAKTPLPEKLTTRQQAVIAALGDASLPIATLLAEAEVSRATVSTLIRKEVFTTEQRVVQFDSPALRSKRPEEIDTPQDHFQLTADQQTAIDAIKTALGSFRPFCLFGPPGSGKTEVYVRAIRAVLARDQQAILLIPEIALATQIAERLAERFPRVAVLHSQLTDRQRADALNAIAAGTVDVVIGTRNAVFAPLPRLGLIVVDEEQESSFKALGAPLFHARDVAVKRAQIEQIPVILGSATPAIETWYNVKQRGTYELLALRGRVPGAQTPQVQLVTTEEDEQPRLLSDNLRNGLRKVVAAGRHAMVLHNRRGYATALACSECRLVLRCSQCHAFLVLHRDTGQLHCHRCNARTPQLDRCPTADCPGQFRSISLAIQRLEEELTGAIANICLIRLDSDRMKKRADYEAALQAFATTPGAVLIGTQMIAKGLDFATVDLVGVIDADAALHLPDFRARETAFNLLMQVVGRAGREAGESQAIVQVRDADDPTIAAAIRMDYETFANRELHARERFKHPPFARLVRIVFADSRAGRAATEAQYAEQSLRDIAAKTNPNIAIEKAEPCLAARLRDLNRYQILLRANQPGAIQKMLTDAIKEKQFAPKVQRTTIDVDPYDFS